MESINFKLYLLFLAIVIGVMGDDTEEFVSDEQTPEEITEETPEYTPQQELSPIEMPYIVSLRTKGRHFCSGSIISHYHILTAAHCLSRKVYPRSFVKAKSYAVTGKTKRNSKGTSLKFKSYHVHPYFGTHIVHNYKYDIAILTLHKKIEMNEHQKIIRLPVSSVSAGSTGIAAGWNNVNVHQQTTHKLFKLKDTVMDLDDCIPHRSSSLNRKSVLCTLTETGKHKGTCLGDSGGPFVVDNTLVGIANDVACNSGQKEIISSVYFYTSWIQKTLNRTGMPGVTKETPESDFYDEDKMEKIAFTYVKYPDNAPDISTIAFLTGQKDHWYMALYK